MIIIIILTIYNKIVKSDWVSTVLISALIGQYISCLSNWTSCAYLNSLFFHTASKSKFQISCVLI